MTYYAAHILPDSLPVQHLPRPSDRMRGVAYLKSLRSVMDTLVEEGKLNIRYKIQSVVSSASPNDLAAIVFEDFPRSRVILEDSSLAEGLQDTTESSFLGPNFFRRLQTDSTQPSVYGTIVQPVKLELDPLSYGAKRLTRKIKTELVGFDFENRLRPIDVLMIYEQFSPRERHAYKLNF